jgi:DNA-binding MarR family transcriptional regulator
MTITPPTTLPVTARDRVTQLLRSLREVTVLWRDVSRVAFPAGWSGLGVLHQVEQQGPMRVSDLATCRHVGVSTMSRNVAELTAAGLLTWELSADDARTHVVRLTPAGRAKLDLARRQVLDQLAPALEGWTEAEVAELECQLTRLAHDLTAATGGAPERT